VREETAATRPVIVPLPVEIDVSNAQGVCSLLCEAVDGGATMIIADMTETKFCDSSGFRMLLIAHDRAAGVGAQLRVAVAPESAVVRALGVMSFDRVLRVYPSLGEAIAAS
jgi:anti-sigma B factor antagonist